jgi:hypothetical protein
VVYPILNGLSREGTGEQGRGVRYGWEGWVFSYFSAILDMLDKPSRVKYPACHLLIL